MKKLSINRICITFGLIGCLFFVNVKGAVRTVSRIYFDSFFDFLAKFKIDKSLN